MTKNTNPTETLSWAKLQEHFYHIKEQHLNQLFNTDENRTANYSITLENLTFDFSKNNITDKTLKLLTALASEQKLKENIEHLFTGKKINTTEDRAVLHTALRSYKDLKISVDGLPVYPLIKKGQKQLKTFTEKVISGDWKGYTGKPITDIVNIGIGGSDLGPQMLVESLHFYKNHLQTHFIANIDGDATQQILKNLNPETTLFVIVSKTFTTIETLTNAQTCKNWFLKNTTQASVKNHFIAVSTNTEAVEAFGINKNNIFPMWSWVGGRFSMWSSVGISIALALGYKHFEALLKGANAADIHFRETDFDKNIPVIMGLLSVWYTNFFNTHSEAILPYAESLHKLVPYLQQLFMESNGKSVDKNAQKVTYKTGGIIFGSTGTNAQHSFMQHIHQGTQLIPVDFIAFKESLYGNKTHHKILLANYKAQTEALQKGKTKQAVHLDMKHNGEAKDINKLLAFKVFAGNRVSNSFLFDKLTPYNLGMLVALYEHKVFVQGVIWNINSFDQFGVELGKEMAKKNL